MVYVPGDVPVLEADGSDAEHDSDLEALQERVDTLAETVDYLGRRLLPTDDDDDSLPSEEVVEAVAETVVDELEQRGALASDDRDDCAGLDGDGGTSRGFY